MRIDTHGLLRGGWPFAERFVPFDAMTALDGARVHLEYGPSLRVPKALVEPLTRVLEGPSPASTLAESGHRLVEYFSGPWAPVRAARALLAMATQHGASDVHLEAEEQGWALRFRLAGELLPFAALTRAQGERLTAALKHLAGCLPYRKDALQEGRIGRAGVAADVRASFIPTPLGERVALRLFGRLLRLDQLGLPDGVGARLERALSAPHGLILVAGPSGAGKTTTVYSALAFLAARRKSAHLSIEDPVEQRLRAAGVPVDQLELCPERGLTGETALAAALRQDVDVLAVGEVRTATEAALALKAAHTGRLVLAGVHAGTCDEARLRLQELGCDARVLDQTLHYVLHQSLNTRACAEHAGPGCSFCGGVGRVRLVEATDWMRSDA